MSWRSVASGREQLILRRLVELAQRWKLGEQFGVRENALRSIAPRLLLSTIPDPDIPEIPGDPAK